MKIPRASKLVVSRSLAASFFCHFPPQVPFISSQNPPFAVLFQALFIIEIENGGTGVGCVQLGIWQQRVLVDLHLSRCSSLLSRTSLAPLCVWVSVCVCAELIDELVSRSMLLLPTADKWWLALPPHPRVSLCLWRGSLQCIDVETQRPESLTPFNPTFQFAFGLGRQYWETADSCLNWIPSQVLGKTLNKKQHLGLEREKISCWETFWHVCYTQRDRSCNSSMAPPTDSLLMWISHHVSVSICQLVAVMVRHG